MSVAPDGTVTRIPVARIIALADDVANEVAAVLWGRLGSAARPWATLGDDERDVVRAIAQEALTPLLQRLADASPLDLGER